VLLYLDCVGGIAGDMLLAGLIDAGAPVEEIRAGLPLPQLRLDVERVRRRGTPALRLRVSPQTDHAHRTWADVRELVNGCDLPPRARTRAHAAFERLARVEAEVHGEQPDEVEFHEVGALDSIADICGVALALALLGVDEVACSPLPLGHGLTTGAHGLMPVPAPATLRLLHGVPVYGVDVHGETVTPTGAALAVTLASQFGPAPAMTISASGTGAGTRDPERRPNVLRALLGEPSAAATPAPLLLETNLDDLLPELVPDAIEACLAAGALDVWTSPAVMKHGRPGFVLATLVRPDAERAVAEAMLRHTTALGLRVSRLERRWELDRDFLDIEVFGHRVRVKRGLLDGKVVNLAPEHRDCARVARETGHPVKGVWAAALAAAHRW
jgi:uncharacterized protein (TIGR00299 family) protein